MQRRPAARKATADGELWNPDEEAFYNAQANASTDSGSKGRWHYPANFEEALPPKPKKKKDRWARTEDAHSIVESDGRKKKSKKKKSRSTMNEDDSYTRRDSTSTMDMPEDAAGGGYGNLNRERAPDRNAAGTITTEADIFNHEM